MGKTGEKEIESLFGAIDINFAEDVLGIFKLNFIKQLKEEMLEGELIKRQTEEDLEREKQREIARQ